MASLGTTQTTGTCDAGSSLRFRYNDFNAATPEIAVAAIPCAIGDQYGVQVDVNPLSNGAIEVTVIATDAAGNDSIEAGTIFDKDTTAPTLADGSIDVTPTAVNDATAAVGVPFTATCQEGNSVQIKAVQQNGGTVTITYPRRLPASGS